MKQEVIKYGGLTGDVMERLEKGKSENGKVIAPAEDDCKRFWTAVLVDLKADLEELCSQLGFQAYSKPDMCGFCEANDTDKPWSHFSLAAAFTHTIYTTLQFRHKYLNTGKQHPIWAFIRTPSFVAIDLLHDADHKGITSIAIGNILAEVIRSHEQKGSLYLPWFGM